MYQKPHGLRQKKFIPSGLLKLQFQNQGFENWAIKRNKQHLHLKGRGEMSLLVDMILYIDFTKDPNEHIQKSCRVRNQYKKFIWTYTYYD
jgi:hypothetical protein